MNGNNELLDAAKNAIGILVDKLGPDVVRANFSDLIEAVLAAKELPAEAIYSSNKIGFLASVS